MPSSEYRRAIAEYIRAAAQPPDKFSHQPRLYNLARQLAQEQVYDDDVLYAAAWMHDLGVFVGHRPENAADLARWDNVAYALKVVPGLLERFGFPPAKIPPTLEAIRTHQPSGQPTSFEGTLLRDADILEQLGAVGILRIFSKVGRDTRYPTHVEALKTLQHNLMELAPLLTLARARELAQPRALLMASFIRAAESEMGDVRV
jgi:uncharacterized protein